MVLLTKRFAKVFKLAAITTLCCLLFILTNKYISQDLPVDEYKSYLQNYIDKYTSGSGNPPAVIPSPPQKGRDREPMTDVSKQPASKKELQRRQKLQDFYSQVFKYLHLYSPKGKSTRAYDPRCKLDGDIGARLDDYNNWFKLTSEELGQCLMLSTREKAMLKENHAKFVENLSSLVLPKDSYKGNGIVTVGGGKFSLLAFLIIKTLRNMHTTLPVEVLIPPKDEGETDFCDVLLPKYNAKCIYISDVLPQSLVDNFEFKGYQFKSLSIIASSFENLLLLDADNFPIKPLDDIFDEEPYKSTGMVLWPDFWRRTTNPAYYDIADIPISYNKRVRNCIDNITPPELYTEDMEDLSNVPLHDLDGTIPDVSTESGQLMISKSSHLPTVLLSLYYNVNGPSWYYPIFSQKAAGEGDKETFIAGANFYGLPFYQVKSATAVDGYHQPDGKGFRGVAMLQHDFVQDYQRYQWAFKDIRTQYSGKTSNSIHLDKDYTPERFYRKYFEGDDIKEVDIMFVHSNLPKFDPLTLWRDKDLIVNGKHIRSYTNLKRLNGYDLELESFKVFQDYLCVQRSHFKYLDEHLQEEAQWQSMCDYIHNRLKFLDSTHKDAVSVT